MRAPPAPQRLAPLAAVAAALALAAPAAALAAPPGSTITAHLTGSSEDPDDPRAPPGAAVLEVAATVSSADGSRRAGVADVTLEVDRGYTTRTYAFEDVTWSGSVEDGPGAARTLTVDVPRTRIQGRFLSLTVEAHGLAAAGPGPATGTWETGDVRCSDDGDAFDDHGDGKDCSGMPQEAGRGAGAATAAG